MRLKNTLNKYILAHGNIKKPLSCLFLMECSVCGKQMSENMLFDAISSKEVVKICEPCLRRENLPILKRPTTSQLKDAEKIVPYYKRVGDFRERKIVQDQVETNLKQIVNKNYEENVMVEKKPRPDMVDNFHWILMRERRARKITQEQLAKEIGGSETVIKMAEQGFLPEDDYKIITKLESFLGVKLKKSETIKAENP